MESRTAEMSFSAGWEAVRWVTSKPRELFHSLPFEAEVFGEEPYEVRLRVKKRLLSFTFTGRLNVAFAESTATYVMKGPKGLLILSASVDGSTLVSRASADLVERFVGKKLEVLVRGFALAVCRFSESYRRIVGKILPMGENEFYVRDLWEGDIPHLIRYLRFALGRRSFTLVGEGRGKFRVEAKDGIVRSFEHTDSSGSAIVEVNKPFLDVGEDDFSGLGISGEYIVRLL